VQGSSQHLVSDAASALKLLEEGTQLRQTAATRLNAQCASPARVVAVPLMALSQVVALAHDLLGGAGDEWSQRGGRPQQTVLC
jgi:hypothetical protein